MTTKILHTDFPQPDAYGALSFPVYNSAAYEFDTAEAMEAAFIGRTAEHTYSRISNPTVQNFENRVQRITNAASVTALNSGMAAISNAFIAISQAGCNIVASPHLFGNTYSLLAFTLKSFGVETRFCNFLNTNEIEQNIDENTAAVFCEIISNPQMEIVDLKQIAEITRKKRVPFIVDTTVIPFNSFSAKEWGIDIELVSSTKYISGGATSLGGLIIDYGTFDWHNSKKLAPMAELFGQEAFTAKIKKEIHRNFGAYMTPQVAYMQTLGLETLEIRYAKATANCLALAEKLKTLAKIENVIYPTTKENPFYELSKKQFGEFAGAMLTFDLPSREACFAFINKLKLICRATNLFDNKTLAIHPASTIFGTFTENMRKSMDISQKTIRLSVGLENVEDLWADLKQAINTN
jgi:O-acetylhomoserine (thiol)-lyase